jgi:predicted RNase H-like HicB family nuclease
MITVKAKHDPEAGVWYIADSSLPGLHLEGGTLDELNAKLQDGIEDLTGDPIADFQLIVERRAAA